MSLIGFFTVILDILSSHFLWQLSFLYPFTLDKNPTNNHEHLLFISRCFRCSHGCLSAPCDGNGLAINSVYQYVVAHSLVSSITRPSQCPSVICVFDMTSLCMGGDGLPCETVWVVLWEVSSTGKSFRKSGDTLDGMVFTIGHYTWLMKTMAVCVPCVGRGF